MNSRDYKILRPGNYYHIFNRGNNKEKVFLDSQDYGVFLIRLKMALGLLQLSFNKNSRVRIRPLPQGSFTIICYCLMPNHYHFLIRQNSGIGIDKLIAKVCTSYAKYFNLKYGHIGNVFQDRFKSKLVDSDSYLTYLSAYIHNNPDQPLDWEYSSFRDYLGLRQGQICDKTFLLGMFNNRPDDYRKFVLDFSEEGAAKIKDLLFEE
ncbi:MAG: transposase [Candidatus Doudnabacteria bacterium]|nr:transposase [Candidatus Doudnabacteria bacterium]